MTVYVLETGEYEQCGVTGVYATAEAAMAAWPYGEWVVDPDPTPRRRWYNEAKDTASVEEYDVEGEPNAD